MIKIPLYRYEALCDAENLLHALQAAGVDKWDGYPTAVTILHGEMDGENMGRLEDGESRTMRVGPQGEKSIEVVALREDSETPYVLLKHDGIEIALTDVGAQDLVERIERALSILPSSK